MSLVVEKLKKNNFILHQKNILQSLKEEYKKTYNTVVDNNQIKTLNEYCISYMYLLVFQSQKSKILGYFSLSRTDLNRPSTITQYFVNYLFGNVYLFDVYVYPKYRNKGIGTYLVRKAVQIARNEYKANNVYLYTNSIKLTTFYNKNKFDFVRNVEIDNNKLLLFQRKVIN